MSTGGLHAGDGGSSRWQSHAVQSGVCGNGLENARPRVQNLFVVATIGRLLDGSQYSVVDSAGAYTMGF